jgi:hypothetical protein
MNDGDELGGCGEYFRGTGTVLVGGNQSHMGGCTAAAAKVGSKAEKHHNGWALDSLKIPVQTGVGWLSVANHTKDNSPQWRVVLFCGSNCCAVWS